MRRLDVGLATPIDELAVMGALMRRLDDGAASRKDDGCTINDGALEGVTDAIGARALLLTTGTSTRELTEACSRLDAPGTCSLDEIAGRKITVLLRGATTIEELTGNTIRVAVAEGGIGDTGDDGRSKENSGGAPGSRRRSSACVTSLAV